MWVCTPNLVLPITKMINIYTLVTDSFQIHIWFHIQNVGMYNKFSVTYKQDNKHLDRNQLHIHYRFIFGLIFKMWVFTSNLVHNQDD